MTLLRWDILKSILVLLLGNKLYFTFIFSSLRLKISRIVSILLRRMSIVNISPYPSLYSGFSMRFMQWKNIFSCSNLVVGGMILDGVEIKDVSNCWIFIVYAEHCKFLVFIIIMDVTFYIVQDQILLLIIKLYHVVTGPRIPCIS